MQQRSRSVVLRTDGTARIAGQDITIGKKRRSANGTAGEISWKGTERDEAYKYEGVDDHD